MWCDKPGQFWPIPALSSCRGQKNRDLIFLSFAFGIKTGVERNFRNVHRWVTNLVRGQPAKVFVSAAVWGLLYTKQPFIGLSARLASQSRVNPEHVLLPIHKSSDLQSPLENWVTQIPLPQKWTACNGNVSNNQQCIVEWNLCQVGFIKDALSRVPKDGRLKRKIDFHSKDMHFQWEYKFQHVARMYKSNTKVCFKNCMMWTKVWRSH